jgi:hypothetical protein
MTTYRAGWLTAYTVLLLTGVSAGIHASLEALSAAFVIAAVACSSAGAVRMRGSARPRRVRARILVGCALVGGTTALALVGYAGLLGQRVALLGLFVLVSSPAAVRSYGRWLRSVPTPSTARLDAFARVFANAGMGYVGVQPEPDPRELTDDELCERWRASCLYLRRRPSAAQVMRAVEQRQIYLDEFERRYPGAFAAWLTSGAGTLDYLTPYAMRSRDDHARINWDELTRGRD